MIKSDKMSIKAINVREGHFDEVVRLVKFLVRHHEYKLKRNSMTKDINELESAHVGVNVMEISEEIVRQTLTSKKDPARADKFLANRKELREIEDDMNSYGYKWKDYTALSESDQRFITMLAHEICSSILLDGSVLDDVDLAPAVNAYIKKGRLKDIEDLIKAIMNKAFKVSEDTEKDNLFYPIKFRSTITKEDVRQFMGFFTGTAKKDADGNFDWVDKSENEVIQIKALTTTASILLSREDYKVILPETETETSKKVIEMPKESEKKEKSEKETKKAVAKTANAEEITAKLKKVTEKA